MIKSPFVVFDDFLSKKQVAQVLGMVTVRSPSLDVDGHPMKHECFNTAAQNLIFDRFQHVVPKLERHYDLKYKGTHKMLFQYYPENMQGVVAEAPFCENSKYARRKWVKCKDVDLTAVLWLKDYKDAPPIDKRSNVYGGKLEMPQYGFSLNPKAGALVVFPAYPHFIQAVSKVLVGDLYQVRINVTAEGAWLYDPAKFPFEKSWQDWFTDYLE